MLVAARQGSETSMFKILMGLSSLLGALIMAIPPVGG
jgi:hypothetical protein